MKHAHLSAESGFKQPEPPAVFVRYASSLLAHGAPIVRSPISQQLDFEGEVAMMIGTGGRRIDAAHALDHVAVYALVNQASIRTATFVREFVTADELPRGYKGVHLITMSDDVTVQSAALDDMVFDVAALVVPISEVMALALEDIIVTGTPAGLGVARKRLWMQPGDIRAVEVEGIGRLFDPIIEEVARTA